MKKIIIASVITFCMAMMPVVCFADETSDAIVTVTKTADVQTASPGDEATFTINITITDEAGAEFLLDPYILESPSGYLEDISVESVTGTWGEDSDNLPLGFAVETANGQMKINLWDTDELGNDDSKKLLAGSQATIVVKAKISEDAPAGRLSNTAAMYGRQLNEEASVEKASDTASITVIRNEPEPIESTEPASEESSKDVRNVSDHSPQTGDESFAGFIWSILSSIF